jgi:hypothetical protein
MEAQLKYNSKYKHGSASQLGCKPNTIVGTSYKLAPATGQRKLRSIAEV